MFHYPSWSQTQSDIWDWAYLIRPKDPKTFPHSEAWSICLWSCSAELTAFRKEVELLRRGFAPSVGCVCVQGASLYTVFPEKWFKSRVTSWKGIKAVQEPITAINFPETNQCFADSLVVFRWNYSEDASVNSQHWLLNIFHFCSMRLFLAAVHQLCFWKYW